MVGAIIQARMTSSRLPGKVLMEIDGRPVIDYLLERLSYCKYLQIILLATTTNTEDDPLVSYAIKRNIPYFRGSEHDVLDRYYNAAEKFGIEHIFRITADCPLVDPKVCDSIIECYQKEKVDFVVTGSSFAEGLDCEIFSRQVLNTVHQKAKRISEREHLTLYIHNHSETFKKITLENDTDDGRYRFTIDEPADFEVVKSIILNLYRKDTFPFGFKEIKQFMDAHPEVFQINAHIIRNEGLIKSLENEHKI